MVGHSVTLKPRKTNGVVIPGKDIPSGPFRDDHVWVMEKKCATCIFRPGNLMHLRDGVVGTMKRGADERGTGIVCHEVMHGPDAAMCRGYYDGHNSALLQVAERLGIIKVQGAPDGATPQAESK